MRAMSLKTILYVEDDSDIRQLVSVILQGKGFEVFSFDSGKSALETAAAGDVPVPDVILMDLMMRDLDGVQTLEKLRCLERYQDKPCVFLTARADVPTVERLSKLPLTVVMHKPFKLDDLFAKLKKLFAEI